MAVPHHLAFEPPLSQLRMELPFKRFFKKPRSVAVHQAQKIISQHRTKLAALNNKVRHMPSIFGFVTQGCDNVVDQVDAHHALMSPVRRLPQELVQEIFIHCLPTRRNAVMSSREAPVLLGRICSHWRKITLSTPRLWSSLHVVSPSSSDEKFSRRLNCLNVWLGRSGALPLSISVHAPEGPEANACKIVASLIPLSLRWKSINLYMPKIALQPLLDLTPEDVPMLETIKLHVISVSDSGVVPGKEVFIFGAPRLRSASLPAFVIDPHDLPLPWQQLTELCFRGHVIRVGHTFHYSIALRLLSQCPNLVSCTLHITGGGPLEDTDLVPAQEPIVLPLLQSFHLEGQGIGSFFDHLILPELRDIRTSNIWSGTPEHIAFRSLLTRSHSLERIVFDYPYLLSADLAECLQLAPSLTQLCIAGLDHERNPQDTLLRLLTPTQDSPGLCPALEAVEFDNCTAFSDEVLLRFLQARLTRVHPDVARLRRIKVFYLHNMELDVLSEIQPLVEAGMEVTLDYSKYFRHYLGSPWEGLLHELPHLYCADSRNLATRYV